MARKSNCRRRAGGALNKGCEGALGLCRTFQVAENAKKPLLAYLPKFQSLNLQMAAKGGKPFG